MKRNSQKTHTAALNKKHSEGGVDIVAGEMYASFHWVWSAEGQEDWRAPTSLSLLPAIILWPRSFYELVLRSGDCHYLFQFILFHSMSPRDLFLA